MSKLDTELFIARRMGRARGSEGNGVMVRIAVATSAVSIAVMIVAVAVIMGFRSEISGKIAAFAGHLRIQALDYSGSVETEPIRTGTALESAVASIPGFRSIAPYALKGGVVKTDEATRGVMLKGVDSSYDISFFEKGLIEGSLPRIGTEVRNKDILVSTSVARQLRLAVDDRVEILFASGERARRDRFRVCGLYSSGFEEMDSRLVLTDIANVRRLNGWDEGQATGYEIVIEGMEGLDGFVREAIRVAAVHDSGEPPLMVRAVTGDYPQLFDWLKTHDVNAAVIITIMIAVALISMISALLIILLERIRMIGILKTLGMRDGSVRRIFVMRAAQILLAGLAVGNVAGISLALVQKATGVVKLDQSGYFLPAVPIDLEWWWIAALDAGTLIVILTLLVFPTAIVSRITPEKTIRYQ